MTCTEFRAAFVSGTEQRSVLAHLRTCDACLDHAAHIDPDVMFRALGGSEMIPPGGVDAFVADVMHSVQIRSREGRVDIHAAPSWPRKLAIAAALATAVTGGTLMYQTERAGAGHSVTHSVAVAPHRMARPAVLTTKPVVDTYSSPNATIVEVPNNGASDVQVVMIFDDSLPADL